MEKIERGSTADCRRSLKLPLAPLLDITGEHQEIASSFSGCFEVNGSVGEISEDPDPPRIR